MKNKAMNQTQKKRHCLPLWGGGPMHRGDEAKAGLFGTKKEEEKEPIKRKIKLSRVMHGKTACNADGPHPGRPVH